MSKYRGLTYLYDGLLALDFEDLTLSHGAISEADIDDLCVFWELDVVEHDQWAFDIEDRSVVDSRCDIVVGGDCFDVIKVEGHWLTDKNYTFLW